MFGQATRIQALMSLLAAFLITAGARAGGELTPEKRRALEQEASKLNAQAGALNGQGKLPEAIAAAEKALALRRRLHPKGHPNLAFSLNRLGFLLDARGDLAGAEPLYREALAMRRRLFPQGHPDLASSLNNLGSLLQDRGDLAGAEPLLREALALRRRLYPRGHPAVALSLNNLSDLLQARGDLAGAEPLCREALALRRLFFPKDHPDLAQSLNLLGSLAQARGDLVAAEPLYREALAMRRRLFPGGHRDLAQSLNNLGYLLQARGDFAGAEPYFRDALTLCRRLYPKDHRDLAQSLNNLGYVAHARGDLVGAEPLYREALAMRRRLFPKGHPDVAASLNNLGNLLHSRGDYAGAEPLLRDALAMRRFFFPGDRPDLAQSLNNLGGLLLERGDYTGAEPLLRDALAMKRRLYPKDHPDLAGSLNNLGSLLHSRRDLPGAESYFREALAMYQRLLRAHAELYAEAAALDRAATFPLTRDRFLSVTRGRDSGPADYALLWPGRSALTRVLEQRHRDLLASQDPRAQQLAATLLNTRQRLAHLLLAPAKDQEQHAEHVRDLTAKKEELEQDLARTLRLTPPAAGEPPVPTALAAALPADACFLDFYRYTHFTHDPKVKGIKGERHTPYYAAFVVAKGRDAVRVELGEAAPLERAWAAWHDAIVKEAPADKERKAAAALARLLWGPLREKLPAGVRAVYLAPDGALTQVPFAALPGAKAGTVLLEEYAFATVPHGPFLLDRLAEQGRARPPGGALLAVGGIDYHQAPDLTPAVAAAGGLSLAAKRVAWARLPATRAEVERVAALAEKHARVKARCLTGANATTEGVLKELPQARYAHLATHGFFADARFRSAFQVDPEAFQRLTRDRRGGARSPLVLSGLVFAGANRGGTDAKEDRGILTAEAVVGLRLDKLELAVLSACNTGLGEVGGGEGVYGLQRAFHLAGCKDVIASLWAVEDESTAALMNLFYSNLWRAKLTPPEALRQAQLHLYRHPGQVKQLARRDFDEVPLPREGTAPTGARARTARWAAFTFSGVADTTSSTKEVSGGD
jgi:CHAT domain-containing protein/Tfp pilus assembly protein PilF